MGYGGAPQAPDILTALQSTDTNSATLAGAIRLSRPWSAAAAASKHLQSSFKHLCGLLRSSDAGRQLEDRNVAEVDFSAFRFKAQLALPDRGVSDGIHELAVDGQCDRLVHANDIVDIPLTLALAA